MIKKSFKILTIILVSVVALLVLTLTLIHSGSLNNFLSRVVSRQINKPIQGELNVGNISGSIFTDFTLHNISLENRDTVLVNIKSARVSYSIAELLDKKLKIKLIHLGKTDINAHQLDDSSWNVMNIIQPVPKEKLKEDPSGEPFFKEIDVSAIRITQINSMVKALHNKEYIPDELKASIALDFHYTPEVLRSHLYKFTLLTHAPDVNLRNFSAEVEITNDTLRWQSLAMGLQNTELKSSGQMPMKDPLQAKAELLFQPLALADVRSFADELKIYGSPDIELNYDGSSRKNQFNTTITRDRQHLAINGWLEGLDDTSSYQFDMTVKNLDAATWTEVKEHQSMISGWIKFGGTGADIKSNTANLEGNFTGPGYKKYNLDRLSLNFSKNEDKLKGFVSLGNEAGNATSRMNISDLFGNMNYVLESKIRSLDIAYFMEDTALSSNLNIDLDARGRGTDITSMKTDLFIKSQNSMLMDSSVEDFETSLHLDNGNYQFTGLQLKTPYFHFSGEGEGHINKTHRIAFAFEPYDLNPLLQPFQILDVNLHGNMTGLVTGYLDSLNFQTKLDFDEAMYDSIWVSNLSGTINGAFIDSVISGNLALSGRDIQYNDFHSDSINLSTSYAETTINNRIYYKMNDSLSSTLQANLELSDVPLLHLPSLKLNIQHQNWYGGSDTTFFAFGKDTIRANHFQISSEKQEISMHGQLAFKGSEDFSLLVRNLNLNTLSSLGKMSEPITGRLNADIHLQGTAQAPILEGLIDIDKPGIQKSQLQQIKTGFQYNNGIFELESNISDSLHNNLNAFMKVPVHLSFRDSIYVLRKDPGFMARLRIDSLNNELFNPFLEQYGIQSKGYISSRIEMTNTIDELVVDGNLQWFKGSFSHEQAGLDYDKIQLESSFSNDRLTLNQLQVHSGKGYLSSSGYIGIQPFSPELMDYFDLKINAKDFKAIDRQGVNATINSSLTVKGPYNEAKINGQLTVLESTLNADVLKAEFSKKGDDPNPPLLVQSMKDTTKEEQVELTYFTDTVNVARNEFYNNLSGNFFIKIPGQTWVRGKDMNFELKGELRAIKEGQQIDLFGDLTVNQGFYKFYGRRFRFEKGSLTFTGGREINPLVDFVVVYSFRDEEQQLRKLRLYLSGRALQPDIRFTLDDAQIEEKDAIAYLLFGRRMENLSGHQATTVEQSTLNITRNLALGKVSNAVQDALQSSLHLDVVEISGGSTWKSGKVTIGKYITDKLFLRYEQNFAFDKKSKTIDPEEIALEYQIFRSFFLQATNQRINSGFDVIFKKSWK